MTRETDIQDESSRQERKTTHIRGEGSAMIQNIDHLVITVRDVEQTCDFYRRVLDLRIITFGDDRKALRVGEQKINLHQAGRELHPCAKSPTPGSADLCFVTGKTIEDVAHHLARHHVPIELGPVFRTGVHGPMTSLYIRDPDNNLIEISTYHRPS